MNDLHISALAWTLIHFLWQGALIAGGLAGTLRLSRRSTANTRYLLACGALALMLLSTVATFTWFDSGNITVPPAASAALPQPEQSATPSTIQPSPELATRFAAYLPWLVYLWLGGVLALSIRTGTGFVVAQKLKRRQATPLTEIWQERFLQLTQRLQISRAVHACESAFAEVPAVVGWLRPVVLVPASALMNLPAADIEALLAHELAHVRRHDYLVNLFQTAVETLLFYHPAVWWTGRQIRAERENCCDDLAVSVCGDVLIYARALTRLEQLRAAPSLAMAANSGSLLARIRRLVSPDDQTRGNSGDWITGIAIVLSATAIYAAGHVHPTAPKYEYRPLALFAPASKPSPAGALINVAYQEPAAPQAEAHQPGAPDPAPDPSPDPDPQDQPAPPAGGFIDGLATQGFKNMDVDQLIAFKIHGVTPEYIQRIRAAGFNPNAEQLVAMRIHGVDPDQVARFKASGLDKLTIDQLLALRIHGATPEYIDGLKANGFPHMSTDQVVAMRIHGVTPEFARNMKALGVGDPSIDQLLAMRIHGVSPEFARSMKAAGLTGLNIENLIAMRIHGVDPAFVQNLQKHGFKDLSVDQIIKLKQFNILDSSDQ